jgi:hypothetical protein
VARTIVWLSWLFERRKPVSVDTASSMTSSQFTTRPSLLPDGLSGRDFESSTTRRRDCRNSW